MPKQDSDETGVINLAEYVRPLDSQGRPLEIAVHPSREEELKEQGIYLGTWMVNPARAWKDGDSAPPPGAVDLGPSPAGPEVHTLMADEQRATKRGGVRPLDPAVVETVDEGR